jgi:hypothetical protein
MTNLHIINIEDDNKYNIVEAKNISQYFKLLEKYCPYSMSQDYIHFNIRQDYKELQTDFPTTQNFTFLHLIDTQFKEYKIKTGWYHFTPEVLDRLTTFISTYIEPISGSKITSNAEYQCDKCKKYYMDKRTLHKHLKECNLLEKFSCSTCGKQFVSQTCYLTHLQNCQTLNCTNCQKRFSSKQALQRHLENCGQFSCETCQQPFTSKYKYKTHCLEKHNFTPII